jgi:hypothetical protein
VSEAEGTLVQTGVTSKTKGSIEMIVKASLE